ncbi:MAG: hypothetical protein IT347_02275 [Candidatus Eisenbacteria bacterium]|nr:hypothetical protein [Candidatus Eisenbacteria bacterium]
MPFRELMTDRVTLVKKDGRRIENIQALISSSTIYMDDASLPIEEDDTFERPLPNGLVEVYVVTDRGFHRGLPGAIADHYQTKVRKEPSLRPPSAPAVFHISGDNARVNINSVDQSANVVNTTPEALFRDLIRAIERGVADASQRTDLVERVKALEAARGTPSFVDQYQAFIASAAAHMTLLSPFIPALTQLLK